MLKSIFVFLMKVIAFIVIGLLVLYYYLSNHTMKTVAEVKCQTYPTAFLQINEYAPITKLWATSDGNIKVTFDDGTKRYFADVEMLGDGNQKIALIQNEAQWQRYVFGSKKLYFSGMDFDCEGN